jgi:signal peptidase I
VFLLLFLGFCLMLCASVGLLRLCLLMVTVTGQSMTPTFQDGDRLLVWRRWPAHWFRRGQIVVLQQRVSARPELEGLQVKRIVALPGEAFTAHPATIRSAMDDQPLEDDEQEEQTWQIRPGQVFVCGDNREQSVDSRTWGPLPQHQVRGVVIMKLARSAQVSPSMVPIRRAPPKWGLPVGRVAPAFSASTLEGPTVTSQQYRGQALLLFFFFAHPSPPMPSLLSRFEAIARRAAEAGVAVLFVSASRLEETRRFAHEMRISRPLLLAPRAQNTLLHDFEVEGMPCYCLVDQAGIVRASGLLLNLLESALDCLAEEQVLASAEQQAMEH